MKKQLGFTLIEVVMVVVVIGVLAAVAVPRFVDIAGDARAATVKSLEGTLRSNAALARSTAIAQNVSATTSITMGGETVAMAFYSPTGTAAGIGATLAGTTGFTITYVGTTGTFQAVNAATAANCQLTYTAATGTTLPPTIVKDITKC